MSVDLRVEVKGLLPPTAEYSSMIAALKACRVARVSVPAEVAKYFGTEESKDDYTPPEDGMERNLDDCGAISYVDGDKWSSRKVIDIKIDKIPPQIRTFRIYAELE